ncbi:hypothetical protein PN462_13775 [Spirulina sp. CS-785/01]|uniref:hypothetical protein n=1 Tax=Spirulina sp. CS-785/01 TaxID=3021716 RepID=UPI00232FEC17|nr:hypothetical protein [Spirulina sp. CS-785/01]MDB9314176.1 hypothetical protein [Spirulina sp. CS-785/01]
MTRLGLILVAWGLLNSCQGQTTDEQLQQAAAAMADMTKPSTLSRSCFYFVYPNGQATEFVQYLFSDLGSAEWPVAIDPMEAEQMKSIGKDVLPPEVRVSPQQRRYPQEKELVLSANAEGEIVAEGYLQEEATPTLTQTWSLATATPDEPTRQLCQSNIEMGIDAGMTHENSN